MSLGTHGGGWLMCRPRTQGTLSDPRVAAITEFWHRSGVTISYGRAIVLGRRGPLSRPIWVSMTSRFPGVAGQPTSRGRCAVS